MYNSTTTIQYLEAKFPHLAEEMHDELWDCLLHPQMAVFSRYAQGMIDSGDRESWRRITEGFLHIWQDCNSDVENALNVSFLENIHFTDGKKQRSWAYDSMPTQMGDAWDKMEKYNQKIHGG